MAFIDWSPITAFVRGRPGQFISAYVTNVIMNKGEDKLSNVLREVDWVQVAEGGNPAVTKALGTLLALIPESMLPELFSGTMSGMKAFVQTSSLREPARTRLAEIVDSIDDETRDLINEGKFTQVNALLRAYAKGEKIPKKKARVAQGVRVTTTTSAPSGASSTPADPPKKELKLSAKQELSLSLLYDLVERASIQDDILDISHARRFMTDFIEFLKRDPSLVNYLAIKRREWYRDGHDLLDDLRDAYDQRAFYDQQSPEYRNDPMILEWLRGKNAWIKHLIHRIQREYIDAYTPFITVTLATAESKDKFLGDFFQKFMAQTGDFFDRFLDRDGRDRWRAKRKKLGEWSARYGEPGVGLYMLVALILLISGGTTLAGGFIGLLTTFGTPRPETSAMAMGQVMSALVITGGFAATSALCILFYQATNKTAGFLSTTSLAVLGSITFAQVATHVMSYVAFDSPRMWSLGPLLLGWALIFGWYVWTMPLEFIEESLRPHSEPTERSVIGKLIEWASKSSPRPPLAFGTPAPAHRRDPGMVVHLTSLADVVSGYVVFFGASILLVGAELHNGNYGHALIASVAGALGNLLAAGEFVRRGRSSLLTSSKLSEGEWDIVDLRRTTIRIGWYLAIFSLAEAVLIFVVTYGSTPIASASHGFVDYFKILWWFIPIIGLGVVGGAAAFAWGSKEKLNSWTMGLVLAGLVLLGTTLVAFGAHAYHQQQLEARADALIEQVGLQ